MQESEILEFYDMELGENVRFEVLEETSLNGETFLLVTDPKPSEEALCYILRKSKDDGEDLTYETVDDEKLLNVLSGIFEELLEDTEIKE